MRRLEEAAVTGGATWSGLMEQAGWGVAQEALRLLGRPQARPIVVLVGPGNNGGDGLVAARHLHDAGCHVTLYIWQRLFNQNDLNWQRCRDRGLTTFHAHDDPQHQQLRHLLTNCDLLIDALLGVGVNRPLADDLAAIVAAVNHRSSQRSTTVLAIDLPTGVNADSGTIHGCAIQADVTVATGMVKRGLVQHPGRSYVGTLRLAEIGISQSQQETIMSTLMQADAVRPFLPARPNDAHKGTFGKLLVIAGSLLYPGAATLATAGAARVGAGLVTLATGRSVLGATGRFPEITLRPLPEFEAGVIGEHAADEALSHVEKYQALVVGPGLGNEKPTRHFLERLLGIEAPRSRGQIGFRVIGGDMPERPITDKPRPELPPTVLDADALNLLSEIDGWAERLPSERFVLTPHPGELKRLLKLDELPEDYVKLTEECAERWKQVVVLKGATTIVARPGASAVHDGANPALATAGTGDVLAGAIGGLLAQGVAPFEAAMLGVYLHGAAGELVRAELGDTGTLASDLLLRLPLAIKHLR
jgi:NAD(P)H-hydrate epimerase